MAEGERRDDESGEDEGKRQRDEPRERGEPQERDDSSQERDEAPDEPDDAAAEGDEDDARDERRAGPVKIVLVALAVVVFLLLGLWIVAALVAPGYISALVLAAVWFVLAAALLSRLSRRRPHLARPIGSAFVGTAVLIAVLAILAFTGGTTTNEEVATGVKLSEAEPTADVPEQPSRPAPPRDLELATGDFEPAAEGSASGRAALVKLTDGPTKLVITDLDVPAGPGLRVYLAPGDGTDVSHNLDLGPLKGNEGDQQYDVPEGTDIEAFPAVVIYSRPLSLAFARAELQQR